MGSERKTAGTGGTNASVGTVAWVNEANITTDDGSNATCSALLGGEESNYLTATNFGFSIPSTAIIQGIKVYIQKQTFAGTARDAKVRIIRSGSIGTTDRADTVTSWPGSMTEISHGGSSDLWGTTWTPAIINASDFGAAISATVLSMGSQGAVDVIEIEVFFTTLPEAVAPLMGAMQVQAQAQQSVRRKVDVVAYSPA